MNVEIKRHLKARPPDWHHCDGFVIRHWARISSQELQELAYRFMVYFMKATFNILIARNTFKRWWFMEMKRSKMANPPLIWVTVTSFLVCTVEAAEQLENIFIMQTPQLLSLFTADFAGIEEVGVKSDTWILTNSLFEKAVQNRHNINETNILFMVKGQRLTNSSSTFCVQYIISFSLFLVLWVWCRLTKKVNSCKVLRNFRT